ncbi:Pyridoxal phosphate homeostasis protein [Dissostichus eleginoides]|uniref:Pyridoxal phosphate homeostasis protein n=1 Tax=Dissostichus eleginoides TaxID=100907 RepID=A0AAD9BWU3_DISEL|nr:Pyridoxal phosphate homeostasis protein [Dissostichus eleginoides]
MDITSYLVLHTSYYTASQMKAYKSLEAFNYLVCGWVNDLGTKEALNKCRLVFARFDWVHTWSREQPCQSVSLAMSASIPPSPDVVEPHQCPKHPLQAQGCPPL